MSEHLQRHYVVRLTLSKLLQAAQAALRSTKTALLLRLSSLMACDWLTDLQKQSKSGSPKHLHRRGALALQLQSRQRTRLGLLGHGLRLDGELLEVQGVHAWHDSSCVGERGAWQKYMAVDTAML